jgi:phosphate transport system permease protein
MPVQNMKDRASTPTTTGSTRNSAVIAASMPTAEKRERLRKWRSVKDRISRYGVAAGGGGVVVALALIFVYLFIEVLPMFRSVSVTPTTSYALPGPANDETMMISLERYLELCVRVTRSGEVVFFHAADGTLRRTIPLALPEAAAVTSFAVSDPRDNLFAFGLEDGRAFIGQLQYDLTYPDDQRHIEPRIEYPMGEDAVTVDADGMPLVSIAVQSGRTGYAIAGVTSDSRIILALYRVTTSFMTGDRQVQRQDYQLPSLPATPTRVLVDRTSRNLFVADAQGRLHYYDISDPGQARLVESVQAVPVGSQITAMDFLVGTVSVIVGGSDGSVSQWFLVRDEGNRFLLEKIREFEPHPSAVTFVTPEYTRKGFYTGDAEGRLAVHYATSARTLFSEPIVDSGLATAAVNPLNRGLLLLQDDGVIRFAEMWNQHPQVSWSALWNKVHYEGREEPDYVWQSSSGSDDFESKFSMMPLTVGTLKAAFYAMLFAMPLAIMGAVYSAYFMTARMRGFVKPTIEVMEALPTVILGFLAGLWFAPFLENNLPAVFSVLLLMPLGLLLAAGVWTRMPTRVRHAVGPGWEAAILVPVVILVGWICVGASPFMELTFFDGNMRQWLTDVGINYDQRNALVVGVAMGFAVIPTIFSIAEDAVFNVPKHLTQGSLALGATAWQTVVGVVLPTASPGIFSAVMIGFGRAVGETMIVLMATGNSPVVNFNIFEGMRTLSANIAVELPETAVASTHYRILFLAALILFSITFIVNTVAEVVRQRLRQRYASL